MKLQYWGIALGVALAAGTLAAQAKKEPAEPGKEPTKETKTDVRRLSTEERLQIIEEEMEKAKLQKATAKQYKSVGGMGPAASEVYHQPQGVTIGGYGEANYNDFRSNRKTDQLDLLRMVLYAGYKFNDSIIFNSEVEFEHAGTEQSTVVSDVTGTPLSKVTKKDVQQGEVYVEFAYVEYKFHPMARLAMGLNLLPIGIMSYMHEPTTFYSVNRPLTETAIIPSTWREMGAVLTGDLPGHFTYRTGIVNGGNGQKFSETSWISGGRSKGSKAKAEDFAGFANLEWKGFEGLTVGTSYYRADNGQNEVAPVDWRTRFSVVAPSSDPTGLITAYSEVVKADVTAPVRTHLAEGHVEYRRGPVSIRALAARGWMNEDDTRAINKSTGKNIGKVVEGRYLEFGFNLLSFFKTEQKLYAFVRGEAVNTQKNTVERYSGGKDDWMDAACSQLGCKTTTQLTNKNRDIGIIENADTAKETYGVKGVPDRVNDRRIVTVGVAYFPHENIALKLDYQRMDSMTQYHKDIETRNAANNKIDQVNFGLAFIF